MDDPVTVTSGRAKALICVASTQPATDQGMAGYAQIINWDVPDTPAARKLPLSSATNTTPALLRTPQASLEITFPRHLATLPPTIFYSRPIEFGSVGTPATPFSYSPCKRKHSAVSLTDENTPPASSFASDTPAPPSKRQKRASPRTPSQKIEAVLLAIKGQNWSFSSFLYNVFRTKDDKGKPVHRSTVHAQMVSRFLAGRADNSVSDILAEWMATPDGRIPARSPNRDLMYSTSVPYTTIKPVRAALTSFATQIIGKKVAYEAECAVHITSGLHVSIGPNSKHPETQLQRHHIGAETIPLVRAIIDKQQPVTVFLCNNIAMRRPRTRAGAVLVRKTRPPDTVITHAIAAMNFCRTDQANLLPLARGILYFGSSAPVELMNYNCRIGSMPAPQTIRRSMIALSEEEAKITKAHGEDPDTVGFLIVDNCQNYHKQNDLRIGRESVMNVGMAGLYFEAPDVDPAVFDLTDKRERVAHGLRKSVTVDDLLALLDQADSEVVGSLMFIECLARIIPSLKPLRAEQWEERDNPHRAQGRDARLPPTDWTNTGEIPNTSDAKLPVGGDGLTYAMLQQLQTYLQFHDDAFKSFEIFEPQLQVWHTKWTDIIRIFQTHWGRTSGKSTNPASLGYSAGKIGRAAPSNMKKVEFYQGAQLLNVVLDAKLLNIWALAFKTNNIFDHFETLQKTDTLPDMEELFPMAQKLYRAYATARGRDHALYDVGETSEWAKTVPEGSVWIPAEIEDSSLEKKGRKKKMKPASEFGDQQPKTARKPKEKSPPKQYDGDFVLAQEIDFIRDAMNSRKLATAVAEGDIGRLYECIKYMLFTFAGSSHTNYLNYVLETIMNLEYECSPDLKMALLRGLIWNLTGLTDHCEEGDFIVEFFNRLLEDIVQHKSAQFDDTFIRNIISRNLRHIALLKLAWRTGMGLDAKSSKHANATERPEVRTLYKLYMDVELHHRRRRRQIDDRDTNDFAAGAKKLRESALQAAITKTLFTRQVQRTDGIPAAASDVVDADLDAEESDSNASTVSSQSDSDSDEDAEDDGSINFATRGSTYLVDGELVFDERDMMLGPEDTDEYAGFVDTPGEDEGEEGDGGLYEDPGGSDED
ncbi:hypothetical protein C8R44DRAFT_909020 [Mycena epipterygia]|nr:hypothetical protein C8R44DRAFT_909020 [Mycena epipterygia]